MSDPVDDTTGTPSRGLVALSGLRRLALGAGAVWAIVVVAYAIGFWTVAAGGPTRGTVFLDAMFFLLTLTVPLVLVWLAARLAEELERQRVLIGAFAEAAEPLIEAMTATRTVMERHTPASPGALRSAVEAAVVGVKASEVRGQIDRLAAGQARIEAAIQRMAPPTRLTPAVPTPAPEPEPTADPAPEPEPEATAPEAAAQPDLPLMPEEPRRPDWPTLVRALDFPRDADDREGFRALKTALRHHGLQQVLQAAEDVLNLLSQEGVYVDELDMRPVDVVAWRRFMGGMRGAEVAGVGGIADERAIEAARGLMKSDSIFRDSALFFQRRFDRVLAEFGRDASDAELEALAGTRSGRAFMLLLRLGGSLD